MMFNGYMNKKQTFLQNNSGQVILFVIVAVTIALSMGVAISTRTIFSSSRVARSDTSNKVFTAAEGGAERFSTLSSKVLKTLAAGGYNDSATGCTRAALGGDVTYSDRRTLREKREGCLVSFSNAVDSANTQSFVTVDNVRYNFKHRTGREGYAFYLEPSTVKEINLEGYGVSTVKVCWEQKDTVIYGISYSSDKNFTKTLVKTTDSANTNLGADYVISEAASFDNTLNSYCTDLSLVSNAYGLRLRALYLPSNIVVYPVSNDLPFQAYKITSKGELLKEGQVETFKVVTAYRSFPYLPLGFDEAIYTNNALSL